jgi:hypothetical protein
MRTFAKLIALALLLVVAPQAHAIGRDSGSITSSTCASASSQTISVTVAGANETLIAYGYVEGGKTLSAAYNGVSMTVVKSEPMQYSPAHTLYQFVLANASSGTHNLVLTNSGTTYMCGSAVAYTGTNTASPTYGVQSTHNASGNSSDASVNVTTTGTRDWVVGACRIDNGGTLSGTGAFSLITSWGDSANADLDTNASVAAGSHAVGCHSTGAGGTVEIATALAAGTSTPQAIPFFEF